MNGKQKYMYFSLDAQGRTIKCSHAEESIKKIVKELGVGEVTVGNRRKCG